jgi:hypothetical protein
LQTGRQQVLGITLVPEVVAQRNGFFRLAQRPQRQRLGSFQSCNMLRETDLLWECGYNPVTDGRRARF